MSKEGTTYRVFVGGYAFDLTVDFESEGIADEGEFFEWLSSCSWIDMDDGTTVHTKNILFVQKVNNAAEQEQAQASAQGND